MHFTLPLTLAALSCTVLAMPTDLKKKGESCVGVPAGFHLETVTQTILVKDGSSAPGAGVAAGSSSSSSSNSGSSSGSSSTSGSNGGSSSNNGGSSSSSSNSGSSSSSSSNSSGGSSPGSNGGSSDPGSSNNGGSGNPSSPSGVAPIGVSPNGVAPNVVVTTLTSTATLTSTIRPNGFNGTASTRTTTQVITTTLTTTLPVAPTSTDAQGVAPGQTSPSRNGTAPTSTGSQGVAPGQISTSPSASLNGTAPTAFPNSTITSTTSGVDAIQTSTIPSLNSTVLPTGNLTTSLAQPTSVNPTSTGTSSSTSSSVSSSASATGTGIADPVFQRAVLSAHNVHRANHSAPALTWSDEQAASAQAWSASCTLGHDRAFQNVAQGAFADITAAIHDGWYNGEMPKYASYGLSNPLNFAEVGHFTQVVWAAATVVGCGVSDCNGNPTFVCNYDNGNVGGQYATNVLRPLGQAIVSGSTFNGA